MLLKIFSVVESNMSLTGFQHTVKYEVNYLCDFWSQKTSTVSRLRRRTRISFVTVIFRHFVQTDLVFRFYMHVNRIYGNFISHRKYVRRHFPNRQPWKSNSHLLKYHLKNTPKYIYIYVAFPQFQKHLPREDLRCH